MLKLVAPPISAGIQKGDLKKESSQNKPAPNCGGPIAYRFSFCGNCRNLQPGSGKQAGIDSAGIATFVAINFLINKIFTGLFQ